MSYPNYANNQSLAKTAPPQNSVQAIKQMTNDPKMLARFQNVLGQKAPQFLASVVSAVSANPQLQKATPMSVMGAAMVAATLNLDINPSLGFSAIVPYDRNRKDANGNWSKTTEGQFQIMTKGFVQLAIRSGQYRNINVTEVYADEFEGEDIITGEVMMHPVADGFRSKGMEDKIVGYVAYLELVSGFRKTVYWSIEKILNHARKFSKSYDTRTGNFRKNSAWDTNFEAMCRKTVLKNALSSWGILSVEMQKAVVSDQGVIDDVDNLDDVDYVDNPNNSDGEYEGEAEEVDDEPKPKKAEEPKAKTSKAPAPKKEKEPEPEPGPEDFDDSDDSSLGLEDQAELDAIWNSGQSF
jgi:recombination protein RecT